LKQKKEPGIAARSSIQPEGGRLNNQRDYITMNARTVDLKPSVLSKMILLTVLQLLLVKSKGSKKNEGQQLDRAENADTASQDLIADLKKLPEAELLNVLAHVRELKRRHDALQGA
jgi:hypothetical protein